MSGPAAPARQAVVAEPCHRLRAGIEQVLLGEGYRVVDLEPSGMIEEPVILFIGDGDGMHVLEARDVALAGPFGEPGLICGEGPLALGIRAFVPKPFGAADVLRVARAVGGFDGRRRAR